MVRAQVDEKSDSASSSINMIGSLLRSAASTFSHQSTPRSQPQLESVTEEAHTRDLLFPDVNLLRTSLQGELPYQQLRPPTARDAGNADDRGSLDVSYPADIRIIIAQDANSRYHQPQIIYDSKPFKSSDSRSNSPQNEHGSSARNHLARGQSMTGTPRRGHTPSNSLFSGQIAPLSPTSPRSPDGRRSFGDTKSRASAFDFGSVEHETAQGKVAKEAKEETDALLGCMFGAPGFRLEPSTKIHVVPKQTPDGARSPTGTNRPISSGGFNRRRTPLVRSTSAADFSNGWAPPGSSDEARMGSKPAVMVTRLFSVSLPETGPAGEDDQSSAPARPGDLADPFAAQKGGQGRNVKQRKVPMYAIAVVLQLPPDGLPRPRAGPSQAGMSSLGSSFNDQTPASSWRAEQSSTFSSFMEIRAQTSIDSVLNPHIAQVMQHWNVLSRAVELLEVSAKARLKILLEQNTPVPLVAPPRTGLANAKAKKPKPQSQQSVYVMADCLQDDWQIKRSTDTAAQTIVNGLKARRVVVGQGRWGAWKEEARWVAKWAGSREQNFFFFNFLTAFLGNHTAWLESLSPIWYRRRYIVQQRLQGKDNRRIPNRTVIVSSEKMAARRLIFLLATFFPSQFNHAQPLMPNLSSSQQFSTFQSGSPSALALHGSTTAGRGSASHRGAGHNRTVSFSLMEATNDNESAIEDSHLRGDRRESDSQSLRSQAVGIPRRTPESRKASLSTVTAEVAQAVPHFSNMAIGNPNSPTIEKRPGSGGSMASTALSQNLMRSESNLSTSTSARWGSMVSGFWSNRRDSTDYSDVFPSSQDSPTRTRPFRGSAGALEAMVEEAGAMGTTSTSASPQTRQLPKRLEDCLIKPQHPAHVESTSQARSIPRPSKIERLPLKLSFNDNDGYIDVAMPPTHSFSSSLASSFASIRLPQQQTAGSSEHYSPYGSITSDSPQPRSEPNIDIAGWLKTYQPDFTVQAVRPYDSLVGDIKASMYGEAQLMANGRSDSELASLYGNWTDVCSTLLADTTKFTIERLRLRIRHRPGRTPKQPTPTTPSSRQGSFARPASPRFPDPNFETDVVTEQVMDLDPTLIDAVEKVLGQSGGSSANTSRGTSTVPSRPSSPPRSQPQPQVRTAQSPPRSPRPASTHSTRSFRTIGGTRRDLGEALIRTDVELPHAECRKAVLGALEEVVKSVIEEKEEHDRIYQVRGKMIVKEGGGVARRPVRHDQSVTEREPGLREDGGSDTKDSVRSRAKLKRRLDSTLREGVRKWLAEVEEGP